MKINYKVRLILPAVTASLGVIGKDNDITVKLSKEGKPYFNGKHIKGILKDRVLTFKRALGEESENFLEKYFGKEGNNITKDRFQKLRFSNLVLEENETDKNLIDYRYGIRVDRRTKSTIDNSLFNYEFLKTGTIFEGSIEVDDDIDREDLKFILASLFHLDYIGGLKSRGLGKVEVTIEGKNIDELDKIIKDIFSKKKESKNFVIDGELEKFNYILKLEEPIILKEKELGNYVYSKNIIQGSTVRGALIESLLRNNVDLKDLLKIEVSDALYEQVKLASSFETKYEVPKFGGKVKKDKVVYTENEVDGIKLERNSLGILSISENEISVEIDDKTKSAKENMLFNSEFIEFSGELKGDIVLPKGLFEKIKEEKDEGYVIYLGKNKSKGFGKGVIKFTPYEKPNIESIEKRIQNLNKLIGDKEKTYITFDMESDLVLPFDNIYDVEKQFRILLGFGEKLEFCSKRSFINTGRLAGYNIVNNKRKSDELIICRGSVLTFIVEKYTEILKDLKSIEEKGLGLRKYEGFGRVKICTPRKGEN